MIQKVRNLIFYLDSIKKKKVKSESIREYDLSIRKTNHNRKTKSIENIAFCKFCRKKTSSVLRASFFLKTYFF